MIYSFGSVIKVAWFIAMAWGFGFRSYRLRVESLVFGDEGLVRVNSLALRVQDLGFRV
jgi:hypothetical protein